MKAGEETSDEAKRKAGIEWLNNQLNILSAETLKSINNKIEGSEASKTYTDSEKTILAYWVELNKQRYANTSHHIHFTLDKVHDSFKVFMQLFAALAAFIIAVFSGKFGTWIMGDQITSAKNSVYIFLAAMAIAFSIYLFFWANKWGQFRNLEYDIFGGFLKDYNKLDSDYKSLYPIILIVIIILCCGAMAIGLNQLVDESKKDDYEGLNCLKQFNQCSGKKCFDELKVCLTTETADFDTKID